MSKQNWFHAAQKEVEQMLSNSKTDGTKPLYQYSKPEYRLDTYSQTVTEDKVYNKYLDKHTGDFIIVEIRLQPTGEADYTIFDQRY